MIGYVTLGSDDMPRARAFYDELLGSTIGAERIMEFGDEAGGFTLWGTGFDKPGIAVTNPYNKQPAVAGNGNMTAIAVNTRAKVDALHDGHWNWAEPAKGRRGSAARKFRRPFTAPISATLTATSSAPSGSGPPTSGGSGGDPDRRSRTRSPQRRSSPIG